MKALILVLGFLGALVLPVHAAWIQYDTATMEVLGYFDVRGDSRPKAGTELMQVQGSAPASDIAWPVPPTCTTGRWNWTRVRLPSSLVVDPSLTFYRCEVVENWEQVKDIRDQLIAREKRKFNSVPDVDNDDIRSKQFCPASNTSDTCKKIRTKIAKLKLDDTELEAFDGFLDTKVAIVDDAKKVKNDNGW